MFDFSFSELAVIGVVALVVIGPERMPKVARTVGQTLGRLQRYVNSVKSDIEREMQLEELKTLQAQVKQQAEDLQASLRQQASTLEANLRTTAADLSAELNPEAPQTPLPPPQARSEPSKPELPPESAPTSETLPPPVETSPAHQTAPQKAPQ